MLRLLLLVIAIVLPLVCFSTPRVPSTMEFAGIKLLINDAARKQIQTDVDALHRSQTYFLKKVEKVEMYFPIIERVFREENLPEDFKYLVIQESALIADAVSVSNAVGFWQFKEMTAKEVGLRVDRQIDERMNITASSHGAAKYLKKNNFFFDNWIYALMAYNTGPGGAEKHVEKKYMGASRMNITKKTHWYVLKFLAHKIAFESALGKNPDLGTMLYEYSETGNKSLREIADQFRIDPQLISEYNKWIKRGKIPSDKNYTVVLPVSVNDTYAISILNPGKKEDIKVASRSKFIPQNTYKPVSDFDFQENEKFPVVKTSFITKKVKINGLPGFIASERDNLSTITIDHGITLKKFMKCNEMTNGDEIVEGQVYYLKSKKNKAKIHYHVVLPGESAWSISQKYGLKVKKLLEKNRLREEKELDAGMVMWLRFIRPSDVPVEYRNNKAKNLIVQSSSNSISHPPKIEATYPNTSNQPVKTNTSIVKEEPLELVEETDFLFEEIDSETDFIDENSYIDINNIEELSAESSNATPSNASEIQPIQKTDKKVKKYHIVKSGETLFSISRMYDVSIGKIRQWNDIQDLDVLAVGQSVIIYHDEGLHVSTPEKVDLGNYQTYIVRKNDTLYSIARSNGLSIKELMDLNNKEDFNIHEGEVLKIKRTP